MSATDESLILSYAYDRVLRLQAQQMAHALAGTTLINASNGEKMRHSLIGKTTPTLLTARNQATPVTPVTLDDRWSVAQKWVTAQYVDTLDLARSAVMDVNSQHVQSEVAGLNRQKDSVIIGAISGTAITGQTGTGTQTLPSGQKIASTVHTFDEANPSGSGAVGMTYYKALSAKQLLLQAYGQSVFGRIHGMLTAQEFMTMLASTKLSSQYYIGDVQPLMNSEVPNWLGIKWHLLSDDLLQTGTSVPGDGGTNRFTYMWVENGVSFDVNEELFTRVEQIPLMNYSWQLYAAMTIGAVRLDDKAVVQIANDPTTMF